MPPVTRQRPFAAAALLLCAAGCASSGGSHLQEVQLEQVRSLATKCYIANRHVLAASHAPEVRFACRDWAERQAGIGT